MRVGPVRDPRQLGLALRQRRSDLALTQTQVAERAGIRVATVSAVENGDPGTKASTVFALLLALDLEIAVRQRTTARSTTGLFPP